MQDKPLDFRIQKTYKSLINAFLKLMQEKQFENITVNEICDRAEIRRATFYKHFGDKYEFFTFMVQYIQDDFRKKSVPAASDDNPINAYILIVRNTLDFMELHEDLVESALKSSAYPILLNLFSEQIVRDVKAQFKKDEKSGKELLLPADLMAQVYTGALVNIVRWWVTHKDKASKEDMLKQITKLIEKLYSA